MNQPRSILVSASIISRSLLCAACILCALIGATGEACAASCEAVVVKSADLKPYRDALRGFDDACTCEVREMRPGEVDTIENRSVPRQVVVAIGTTAFRRVKALQHVPVVYIMLVSSESGSILHTNISGVSMEIAPEAYLSAMRQSVPGAKRIGLLYNPLNSASFVSEAARAAHAAGMELVTKQVHEPSAVPSALEDLNSRIDILWMIPDPSVVTADTTDMLLRYSFQRSIPIFSFSRKYAEMGAVASLDVDPYDMGAQAAEIVSRLQSGGADAVRMYARKSVLTINRTVAEKMGLRIRDDMLNKVRIIE